MPSHSTPWAIYREALAPLTFGDALWEPSPIYSYRRVRLGDVGYINEGRFHLLFSAGIPLGTRVLGTDVPLTFEPLDIGPVVRGNRPEGHLHPEMSRRVGVDVGGSVAVAYAAEPGAKVAFELTNKQGAALITKHPTRREGIERGRRFVKYIKQHYESWVDFARENDHPEDVRPILVAGVDLTREFATVAYSDNQTRVECEFSAALPGVASTSVSVWGSWHTAGLVHTNCGPYPTWESPSSGESSALEPEIQDEYTQCVFIKYYIFHKRHTIRKRLFLPIVLKAGAGPHQLPKRDREDGNSDEEGLQVLSVDDSTEPGPDHPETGPPGDEFDKVTYNVPTDDRDSFDVVAEFIFQRSDAKSVLLHHDDIQDFLQGDDEDLPRLLAESGAAQRIEVDEDGVGQLSSPAVTESPRLTPSDYKAGDDTRHQALARSIMRGALAANTQQKKGWNADFSSVDMTIKGLNLAEDVSDISLDMVIESLSIAESISDIMLAKDAFGTVRVLLTSLKDSLFPDYVELGFFCVDICSVLARGLNGKKLEDLSQSVCQAINRLTRTAAEIHMNFMEQRKRPTHLLSPTEDDEDTVAAWKLDLNGTLHVFNTELGVDTHATVSSIQSRLGESPPPAPRACFGRHELIDKIVRHAENLTPVALVGPGGIGKTSIALAVLHHDSVKKRFGENRRFIRCDQFPATLAHFLNRLSEVIGAGVENPEDLTSLYPSLYSRETLIILDNAEAILDPRETDAEQIYALVKELGRLESICLCITSGISTIPSGCEIIDIPTLSIDAARETFYHIYREREQSNLISDDILGQLDFHPLSITLLATVAYQNKWDTERLTREWKTRRTSVLQTEHNKSFAATIELTLASPAFQEHGPGAREILDVIAFFPQGIDENRFDWLFPTVPNGTAILDMLCTLSLTYRSNGFITMLAPLRDYLYPNDPKSSLLPCTAKQHYFALSTIGLVLGIKPPIDPLVVDKSNEVSTQISKIYTKLADTFRNSTLTMDEIDRALYALEAVNPIAPFFEEIAQESYHLFHIVMQAPVSPTYSWETKWKASRFAMHGAYASDKFLPLVGDPQDTLIFLNHHFTLASRGDRDENQDEPIQIALRALAYASDSIAIAALERFDPTGPSFIYGIYRVFQDDKPLQLRKAALLFLPLIGHRWFNTPHPIMAPDQMGRLCMDWASVVDSVEHSPDVRKAILTVLLQMINSPHWRPHIVTEKWGLLEYYASVPADSRPLKRCIDNPELMDAVRNVENPVALGLWLEVLWSRYGELLPEVRRQLGTVTWEVAQGKRRMDLDKCLKALDSELGKAEDALIQYSTWSVDPTAVALRTKIDKLQQARASLLALMRN